MRRKCYLCSTFQPYIDNGKRTNQLNKGLDISCPPEDLGSCRYPSIVRMRFGIHRWSFPMDTCLALLPVCIQHADRRQLHQRLVRLLERKRPRRPFRPGTRLRPRMDYPLCHEERNDYHHLALLRLGIAIIELLWT